MKSKVFISHASKDKKIVSLFVDYILCSGSGLRPEDFVYTSQEDSGVTNGDDIPSTIKDGIKSSSIFFMMVSDAYRKSEVCLNEMGAAWMMDELPKKIILLPGIGFDRIGWLMSLSKGTQMTDEEGLDAIHDQIMEIMSARVQTATWNRFKARFLEELQRDFVNTLPVVSEPQQEDEPMDLLDYTDDFENHFQEHNRILRVLTQATITYKDRLIEEAERWKRLQSRNKTITTIQIRGMMGILAKETDALSEVYENNTPLREKHFAQAMDSAISLQKKAFWNESVRKENSESVQKMIETMKETKDALSNMRDSMDRVPDLDKSFRKSKKRLQSAIDILMETISSSIRSANEFLLV